jgi:hypothetical protein
MMNRHCFARQDGSAKLKFSEFGAAVYFRLANEVDAERRIFRPFASLEIRSRRSPNGGESMVTILLILLILALFGALPSWPYSTGWGYYPSGGIGLVILVLIVLLATGRA